jgi:exodeoxyribonuclease VII large subunit
VFADDLSTASGAAPTVLRPLVSAATDTQTLTVSAYAARVERVVRQAGGAIVEGEVQKPRTSAGGAFMFDLTDGDALLPCKVLPWVARRLAYRPTAGELVRVRITRPDFWPKGGRLSVEVDAIEPAGDGPLLARRAALIERLRDDGLCDRELFPALPRFPMGVGVVAGVGSDALADVLRGLADRFPCAAVVTACCQVQGVGAPAQLIDRLAALDADPEVEVIIVARGGGSVQDLAAFDDERLCRAIRAIATPVITAIGHTTNSPVVNFVTHAAFVPRHAAERAVPDRGAVFQVLEDAVAARRRAIADFRRRRSQLVAHATVLRTGAPRVGAMKARLADTSRLVDDVGERFLAEVHAELARAREAFAPGPQRARAAVANAATALDGFAASLEASTAALAAQRRALEDAAEDLARAGGRIGRAHRINYERALKRMATERSQAGARILAARRRDLEGAVLTAAAARHLRYARDLVRAAGDVLAASDPRRRGWLVAMSADGDVVRSSADVARGDRLTLRFADGRVDAAVEHIHPDLEEFT